VPLPQRSISPPMKQQQRSEGENEPEHAPNQHWPCARVAEHGRNRHRRENRAHAQSCDYRQRHNQRGRARRTRRHAATLARVLETFLTESRAAPTRLGGRARVAETPSHDAHHQMRKSGVSCTSTQNCRTPISASSTSVSATAVRARGFGSIREQFAE